ncbi:hypothetical protein NZA98_35860, partial [Escherichia coli]|nr:hypothetical protein [Escherichia coli]
KTVESRFVFSRKVISEATFDDTTPWTPSAKVGPHDTKIYDLQFFDGWSKGSSQPHRIEVAVFIRASDKPFIARRWG